VMVVGLTESVMPCVTGVDSVYDMMPPGGRHEDPSRTRLPLP
jgi:hypothetical protein